MCWSPSRPRAAAVRRRAAGRCTARRPGPPGGAGRPGALCAAGVHAAAARRPAMTSLAVTGPAAGGLAAAGGGGDPSSPVNVILWVAVPYIAIAIFVVGHYWRYRYDKFGWTTRSSQLYERRLLRLGSPLFHCGILLVALVNDSGISETAYHVAAVGLGTVSGFCTLA